MRRTIVLVCLFLLALSGPGCRGGRTAPKTAPPNALRTSEIAIGDAGYESTLLHGFYKSEGIWRWTARTFSVVLSRPPGREPVYLKLDFALPSQLVDGGAVTLAARVNSVELPKQKYKKPARILFTAAVPEAALQKEPAIVEFELDSSFREESQEKGIQALTVSLSHNNEAAFDREAEAARARDGFEYLLAKRKLAIPVERQREMLKLFHEVPIWTHMFFHNVQIEKCPLDLWMMQQIMYETQPEFVVETGTFKGGSALYWAHTLNGLGLEKSRVLTVDIQNSHPVAESHPLWKKYVTFFQGSSTDPDIVGKIASLVKGRKTLIALDSDHTMTHVMKELAAYAPLVSPGSYLVVEDTAWDAVPMDPAFGPGPMAAVNKFLEEGGRVNFEQDTLREAYIMTFNPGGWLRRKR